MTIQFRAVILTDLTAVQTLIRNSFEPALHPYMISTQAGAEAFLRIFISYPQLYPERQFILSETEFGELLGYAEFRLIDQAIGFLSYICVAPSARGQGVATQLIQHYLTELPQVHALQLDVFTHNEPALALYRKLGFISGDQNVWWLRDLKAASKSEDLSFDQFPQALAALEKYGFCELTGTMSGRSFRLGLMGTRVLRCFSILEFANHHLSENVAAVLPRLNQVLAILPATDRSPDPQAREINRSVRMAWVVPPRKQEL